MTALPAGLADPADHYDVLLSDLWGVIPKGRQHFAEACAALVRYRAERGPVVLISNSPRPAHDVVPQLDALGVPREAWSTLVTSGDATRMLLAERSPGPAWIIGPERDGILYEGLGLTTADPDKAAFIAVTGPYDDEIETPEDYRARFVEPASRRLTMICANPDRVVQRGSKLIYCGGALADLYREMGGRVLMAGKPYAPIYDLAPAKAERRPGRASEPARVLCIGDGVHTDVQGAEDQGLDCLFIARGIHGDAAMGPDGRLSAPGVDALLAAEGVKARYAMADLAW